MANSFLPVHGGQLGELAERFGLSEESLLDFSACVNPHPPDESLLDALCEAIRARKSVTCYPDTHYRDLKRALAEYTRVEPEAIAIGNGVMTLLAATLRSLKIRKCMVLVPAFVEYRRTLAACDVDCCTLELKEEDGFLIDCERVLAQLQATGAQALLLANPQSPSGRPMPAAQLNGLRQAAWIRGVAVIVDEAYIDYCAEHSVVGIAAEAGGLVVLRSLTKFFSMPGLRVAYAVADPGTRFEIEASIPLWPVDSIAALAAQLSVMDHASILATRSLNHHQRTYLQTQLSAQGFTVFPSAANYLLLKLNASLDGAEYWRRLLVEEQLVVRSCANFEGLHRQFLRVGVRTRAENDRLLAAMARVLI